MILGTLRSLLGTVQALFGSTSGRGHGAVSAPIAAQFLVEPEANDYVVVVPYGEDEESD